MSMKGCDGPAKDQRSVPQPNHLYGQVKQFVKPQIHFQDGSHTFFPQNESFFYK